MKCKAIFSIFILFLAVSLFAGEPEKESKHLNKRFSFGALPSLSYDSDLGIKYGGTVNIFDYGKKNSRPHYNQYLFMKFTNTTKGTLNLQAILESESIIRKAKIIAEASYYRDKRLDFFGFNGTEAVYNKRFTVPDNSDFRNEYFYAHKRNLLRLRLDVQKYLAESKFRLLTGFTFNGFNISATDGGQNTIDSNDESSNTIQATLYEDYVSWDIISPEEKTGGNIGMFSLGLIYDYRNNPIYCTKGKWFEIILLYSPDFLSDASFTKLVTTYRQHKSFVDDKLTFSFRISSQQRLSGDIPFYYLPTYYDSRLSQDGIGGAFTLRGVMRNRIVADGFITGNFEIKAKIIDYIYYNRPFSYFFSIFYDNAYITQVRKINLGNVPKEELQVNFNQGKQKVSHTFGPGLYIIFNKNNVITMNYGFSLNKQLGSGGFYVGTSLLF